MDKNTIINQCIQVFDQHLTAHLKSSLLSVLKDLFSNAENATSNQDEQNYFSWYRQLKDKGKDLALAVKSEVKGMPGFISAQLDKLESPTALSLVAEEELSITLALTQMDSSLEVIAHAELYTLEKRMNVIYGSGQVDQSNMPFSPPSLVWVLSNAINRVEIDTDAKVLVLEALTKVLSREINTVYQQINQIFIDAGILPNIKPQYAQSDSKSGKAKEEAVPSEAEESTAPEPEGAQTKPEASSTQPKYDGKTQELVESIFQMLTPGGGASQPNPAAEVKNNEFDQALTQLSQQTSVKASSKNMSQLKEQLADQVKNNTGNFYPELSAKQSQTMDLMGMVYDEIETDEQIDSNIRSSFNTINIPLLRLAVNDDTFFTDENHPARRYMELLVESSQKWHGTEVIKKVHQFSDSAAKTFDGSGSAFDRAATDLDKYLKVKEKRAIMAERKWVSAAKGKEKMDITKAKVADYMSVWLKECQIPFVKDILKNVWEDALTLTLLREGEDSEAWQKKTKAAASLAKMGNREAAQSLKGTDKLQAMHLLDETMDELGFSLRDRQSTKDNIHTCIAWESRPENHNVPTPELKKVMSIEEAKKGRDDQKKDASEKKIEEIRELTEDEKKQMEKLITTPYGSLFDFSFSQRERVRKKLSWVSTLSKKILFVDLTGRHPDKMDLPRVAIDVHRGNIIKVEIEKKSYFQSALSKVMARLKKFAS
ncbi:DUF1631 family protein [Marinicella rhabdoformis]|uniref:DUF1631 family protein n=1 Tax=Marinicella rhabdoformis TaxID=2580566 RepID=UPI0012AEC0A7|nr:DUF1631 family protein [Marinicella rhabdoformis]